MNSFQNIQNMQNIPYTNSYSISNIIIIIVFILILTSILYIIIYNTNDASNTSTLIPYNSISTSINPISTLTTAQPSISANTQPSISTNTQPSITTITPTSTNTQFSTNTLDSTDASVDCVMSDWTPCQAGGAQKRVILTPATGSGKPCGQLVQSCTPDIDCVMSDWSPCISNGTQTRSILTPSSGKGKVCGELTQSCTHIPITTIIGNATSLVPTNDVSLNNGESILSQNNKYKLIMQDDNNLVLYKDSNALWSSNTSGKGIKGKGKLIFQNDGNVVIYDSNGPLWSTNTGGKSAKSLRLQDDGNLILYSDNLILWATNTNIGTSNLNPFSIKINNLCLDAGQNGNPTGKGQGVFTCNGGTYQQIWIDNKGLLHSNNGQCLNANLLPGNLQSSNWFWDKCDTNNINQIGFKIITNSTGQKAIQYSDKECLDIGNKNLHYPCDPGNSNQMITF